jgi:hypothetical protein
MKTNKTTPIPLTDKQEEQIATWMCDELGYEFAFTDPTWMEDYVHHGELTFRDMFDIMVKFATSFDVKKLHP